MSESYKDSPKPLRKSDPDPLFKEADDGYVVKAMTPMQRQRATDGSLHSMNQRSRLEPKGLDLFLSEEKIDGIDKSVTEQMEREPNPDEVVKAWMEKGDLGATPASSTGGKLNAAAGVTDEDDPAVEKGALTKMAGSVKDAAKDLVSSAAKAKSIGTEYDGKEEEQLLKKKGH